MAMKRKKFKILIIFLLVFSWFLASWPQIFNFPPEIQEAEAATVTLRPNADDAVNILWTAQGGASHFVEVNEATRDDDTTYIWTASNNAVDEFELDDTAQTGTINSVTVHAWARSEVSGNDDKLYVLVQDTAGPVHLSTTYLVPDTTYVEHTFTWTQNPQTLVALTWSDINTLRAAGGRPSPFKIRNY